MSLSDGAVQVEWDLLPPGITSVTIYASVNGIDQLWSADAGGWVAAVSPEQVQAGLHRKAAMLSVAKANCSAVGLVIVNDAFLHERRQRNSATVQ